MWFTSGLAIDKGEPVCRMGIHYSSVWWSWSFSLRVRQMWIYLPGNRRSIERTGLSELMKCVLDEPSCQVEWFSSGKTTGVRSPGAPSSRAKFTWTARRHLRYSSWETLAATLVTLQLTVSKVYKSAERLTNSTHRTYQTDLSVWSIRRILFGHQNAREKQSLVLQRPPLRGTLQRPWHCLVWLSSDRKGVMVLVEILKWQKLFSEKTNYRLSGKLVPGLCVWPKKVQSQNFRLFQALQNADSEIRAPNTGIASSAATVPQWQSFELIGLESGR